MASAGIVGQIEPASAQACITYNCVATHPSGDGGHHGLTGTEIGIGIGAAVGIGLLGILIEHLRTPPPGPPPNPPVNPPEPPVFQPVPTDLHLNPSTVRHVVRRPGRDNGMPRRGETRFVPNEVLVESSPQAIDQIARRYGLTVLESQSFPLAGITLYRLRIGPKSTVRGIIGALQNGGAGRVQPNYVFSVQQQVPETPGTTDGNTASQYALGKMQIEQAQQLATGKGILVAVVDSQIDETHPDLESRILKSFDALGKEGSPHLHGTAMAGAIAAHGTLKGIAPGAELLADRAFDNNSGEAKGTSFAIFKALQWAADNHARVVNMSFAGPPDPGMERMLTAAYQRNIVLVAAAGNAGPKSPPLYPAAYPNVIAVTATDSDDHIYKMANHGAYVAVAAPGVEVLALAPDGSYDISTGTSIAAAEVSGLVALLLEVKPALKPEEVRHILVASAKPLGPKGHNPIFGAGLVNAYRALMLANGKLVQSDLGPGPAKR